MCTKTHLLLPTDHALKERLERILEVVDPLLLETRYLRLDQTGCLLELLLSI